MQTQFSPKIKVFIGIGLFIVAFIFVVSYDTAPSTTTVIQPTVNERAIFIMRCAVDDVLPEHCACIYDGVQAGEEFTEELVARCVLNGV